jgi:hypothetical protein
MARFSTAAQIRCPTRDACCRSVRDITTANSPCSVPRHEVTLSPQHLLERTADLREALVAGLMPQSVVVLAEAVDIDHHHADA